MKRHKRNQDDSEINITPMLDIVFIMLIFFIVTTSFVKESGLDISRPSNEPQEEEPQDIEPILVEIKSDGRVLVDRREVDSHAIRVNLERARAQSPDSPLILAADNGAKTELMVRALDAANLAGIEDVNVASKSDDS